MNLLDQCYRELRADGYHVTADGQQDRLLFEGSVLCGAVFVLDTCQSILGHWRSLQDDFLRLYGKSLSRDLVKAWSIYLVFLTAEAGSAEARDAFVVAEEDLVSARKVLRDGITSPLECRAALYPLLKLSSASAISRGEKWGDVVERTAPEDLRPLLESTQEVAKVLDAMLVEDRP